MESLTAGVAVEPEQLAEEWKRNLGGSDGAVPVPIATSVSTGNGDRVEFRDRLSTDDLLIDQIVYLALHDGKQYSVALTLPDEGDTVSEDHSATVLDSWTWTS